VASPGPMTPQVKTSSRRRKDAQGVLQMTHDRLALEPVVESGRRPAGPQDNDIPWTPAILEAAVRLLLWTVEDYQQRCEQRRA